MQVPTSVEPLQTIFEPLNLIKWVIRESFFRLAMSYDNGTLILDSKQVNNSIFSNYRKRFFILKIDISILVEPLE
jgi:hypothetical protein